MYSHYCLVPNEMLYLDRSHSHHADNVLQFLYVNTCVELCDSMLNCPHQFSFTSIYIYICFLRSRISPASSSLNQRSIHHLCLLSRKPVVLPACHPRLLRSTAVIPWKTRCTSQDMESKNMSPMQKEARIYKNLSLWGSFWSDYIRACTSCNPCKARIEDTIHWFTLEGLI